MSCPAPVLQTKEILEKENPDVIEVLVDNEAAKQNVSRFLGSRKFRVSYQEDPDGVHVIGKKDVGASGEMRPEFSCEPAAKKTVVMVTADRIGHGDSELGAKLMESFLKTLKEMGDELWRLIFLNNGVKLTVTESQVLPLLKELEGDGRLILVCGTCLTHFGLIEKKGVGETTNMLDIVTALQLADKIVNI